MLFLYTRVAAGKEDGEGTLSQEALQMVEASDSMNIMFPGICEQDEFSRLVDDTTLLDAMHVKGTLVCRGGVPRGAGEQKTLDELGFSLEELNGQVKHFFEKDAPFDAPPVIQRYARAARYNGGVRVGQAYAFRQAPYTKEECERPIAAHYRCTGVTLLADSVNVAHWVCEVEDILCLTGPSGTKTLWFKPSEGDLLRLAPWCRYSASVSRLGWFTIVTCEGGGAVFYRNRSASGDSPT
eukprot:jgi/Mesvir1/3758/Mv15032-RA.1